MNKKCIGIDIDCVLANSIDLFIPFLNKKFNKNLSLEEIIHYEFEKCYNVTKEQILDAFKELTKKKLWDNIEPMDYAQEFMHKLSEKYQPVIVTSRPEKYMKNITVKWLKNHNIKYHDVLFMDYEKEKDKFETGKKNKYNFDLFIEDCLDFAIDISKYNIPVILYDFPWNRKNVNINFYRINNLKQGLKIIDELLK
jgi:hypothetical protein